MQFKNKNVLITGASRGIGKATAIAFAKQGANVGINYCNDDKAAETTLSLLEGNKHSILKYDISDATQAEALVNEFIKKFGSIDVLVNNAGISNFHPIDEVDFSTWQESWNRILGTNLVAVANLCYLASKSMIKAKSGRIVNVSSRGAFRGEPMQTAYGASKAGLNSLSQSLAKALGKYNIMVNVVAPGFTETDMGADFLSEKERESLLAETPLKRMATPEEVANGILFLAAEGSEYTTGSILDINGASYLRS